MSDQLSALKLLYDECEKEKPDMIKIDEYIIRIGNNKEDINTLFQCSDLTILHMVCWRGHHEIVKKLLENSNHYKYPIDVNVNANCHWYNGTPLHFASFQNHPLTVQTLLQHPNIEVNKCDRAKQTPLHVACCVENSLKAVIELLKHHNINLNATDRSDSTPLHRACYYKYSAAVVQLLLEHGTITDINATDDHGYTPLHWACINEHLNKEKIKIIRSLVKHPSIIIDKKNNKYETPLEICKKNSYYANHYYNKIIQVLDDYPFEQRWHAFCFIMNYDLFKDYSSKAIQKL